MSLPIIKQLQTLLQSHIGKNSVIIDHKCTQLNEPGENYGSLMVALDVTYKDDENSTKTLHMVAKMCPQNEWIQRMFATQVTFKKEINFYKYLVPTLIEFQKSYNVPSQRLYNMFPECINARITLNPNSENVDEDAILILENLKTKGYGIKDRIVGLNFDETAIVLKDLARFHAVPLAYKLLHPKEFEEHILPHLNRVNIGQEMFDTVAQKFIDSTVYNLKLNEDELKRFSEGMKRGFNFQKRFPKSNELYSTFVHCDFWLNNSMILCDETGKPIGNKIVDFQVVAFGSFAMDLVFFLFTSVIQSVLDINFDNFISIYHAAFIECLQDFPINLTPYTLDLFKNEVQLYGPLEASHIIIMLRAILASREKVKELTDFNIDEMFTQDGLTDTYKRKLNDTVKLFFEMNWF